MDMVAGLVPATVWGNQRVPNGSSRKGGCCGGVKQGRSVIYRFPLFCSV